MSRSTADYVTMLEQLKIPKEDVKSAAELLTLVPEIEAFFCDPSIAVEKKHAAAEKLFPTSVRDLIRLLCDNQDMDRFREIAEQFQVRPREGEDSPLQVMLTCVTEPEEAVRERLLACVQKQYRQNPCSFCQKRCLPHRRFPAAGGRKGIRLEL